MVILNRGCFLKGHISRKPPAVHSRISKGGIVDTQMYLDASLRACLQMGEPNPKIVDFLWGPSKHIPKGANIKIGPVSTSKQSQGFPPNKVHNMIHFFQALLAVHELHRVNAAERPLQAPVDPHGAPRRQQRQQRPRHIPGDAVKGVANLQLFLRWSLSQLFLSWASI